ncbi:phosphatidylserine synthase [Plasmodium gonderi]|uniref:Phosphatidylserine synthase n=1 Tax=Plasmodium gonderi TaxID=77519 RepID=A0A1Y1JH66_PLAGO|nr:phosphatidylserine synthase [Plasmodium gonderi]GAW81590.1 phosphatidylserine synthase [Plasmodium gonderi]
MTFANLLAVMNLFRKYVYSVKRDIFTLFVNSCILVYYPLLLFMNFFTTSEVRSMIKLLFKNVTFHTVEKSYMENCNSLENVMDKIDIFVIAHLAGWFIKAIAIRNFFVLNLTSVTFELLELRFQHILPNFYECWWDHILLDILGCNLLGILIGLAFMKWLNMPLYSWKVRDKFKPNKKGIIFPKLDTMLRKVFTNSRTVVLLIFYSLMTNLIDLNVFFLKAELQLLQTNFLVMMRELFIATILMYGSIHLNLLLTEHFTPKRLYYSLAASGVLLLELYLSFRWKHNLVSDNSDLTNINMVWFSIFATLLSAMALLFVNESRTSTK